MGDDRQEEGEDPTEVHVRWVVPEPTPDGTDPATPWGRPGEDDDAVDGRAAGRATEPPPGDGVTDPASSTAAGATATTSPASDPGSGPRSDRPRAGLVVAVLAVAAVIAVLAGALVVAVVARDDGAEGTTTTASVTSSSTTSPPALAGEVVDIGAGIVAVIPEGALTDDAALRAEAIETPRGVGPLVEPIGDVVQITLVRGRQLAPIRLRFPYEPPADLPTVDGQLAPGAVFALHRTDGTWVPLPVVVDGAAGTATFETDSLSPFGLFTWSTTAVRTVAEQVLGGLTGRLAGAAAPECGSDGSLGIESEEGGDLAWCAEEGDDGRPTVKVSNTSGHATTLRWSEGVEVDPVRTSPLAVQLTAIEEATGDDVLVMAPGDAATFTVDDGGTVTVEAAYDGAAHAVTGLLAAARLLALAAPEAPWSHQVSIEEVTGAVEASGCARELPADMAVAAGTWRAALARCLGSPALVELVPAGAAPMVSVLLSRLAEPSTDLHDRLVAGLEGPLLKVTVED